MMIPGVIPAAGRLFLLGPGGGWAEDGGGASRPARESERGRTSCPRIHPRSAPPPRWPGSRSGARRGLTRFVGRRNERDQLQRALEQAKAGHGQIVGVLGEPGLGKSRLFYEFKLTSQSGCLLLEAFSVSYGKASQRRVRPKDECALAR